MKIHPRLLWLVIAITAIIPSVYFFGHLSDTTFRDSAMGNLFATMVGALIGILIALEINRQQQETQDLRDAKAREREE